MRLLWARFISWVYRRKYRVATKKTILLDFAMESLQPDPAAWLVPHPEHNQRLAEYFVGLKSSPGGDTIAFGDSLLDGPREKFCAIRSCLNFAISGSWANHMATMAADILPMLDATGKSAEIDFLIVGSLGGNPLLQRQPVLTTITHSLQALTEIRYRYPRQRLIVYGIPPTVSIYVNLNAIKFEAAIYEWIIRDGNAVYLPLFRKFAGAFGLFPKVLLSADGVHMTPAGIVLFDELLERGKTAPAGTLVD